MGTVEPLPIRSGKGVPCHFTRAKGGFAETSRNRPMRSEAEPSSANQKAELISAPLLGGAYGLQATKLSSGEAPEPSNGDWGEL